MTKSKKIVAVLGVVAGLGAIAFPLTSYAATTAPTNISVGINEVLSITASANVSTTITNNAAVDETMKPVVTATTNRADGYKVTIKGTGSGSDVTKLYASTSQSISAGTPSQGTSAWGYKGGDINTYTAVTDQEVLVLTKGAATAHSGENTTFTFGVSASSTQAQGTYLGQVTWTVAANS